MHFPRVFIGRRVLAMILVVVVGLSAAVGATSAFAGATPSRAGDLTIVDINGNYGPLTHGGSATDFSIRPPATASCPGDSEHDQWRVQSYLVPDGTDVGAIHWQLQGPGITNSFPLYDWYTRPVSQVLLRANAGAGQPGLMDAFPPMNFAVFVPGNVPAGTYRMGIACTFFRKTDKYWDTTVVISAAANDKPAGFVWRLADAPVTPASSDNNSTNWLAIAGGAIVLVLIAFVVGRRFSRPKGIAPIATSTNHDQAPLEATTDNVSYSNSYSTTTDAPEDSP